MRRPKDFDDKRRYVLDHDSPAQRSKIAMQDDQMAQRTRRHRVDLAEIEGNAHAHTQMIDIRERIHDVVGSHVSSVNKTKHTRKFNRWVWDQVGLRAALGPATMGLGILPGAY